MVSLCYQPAANRITVVVLKARNLPKMDITGLSGTYLICNKWLTIEKNSFDALGFEKNDANLY